MKNKCTFIVGTTAGKANRRGQNLQAQVFARGGVLSASDDKTYQTDHESQATGQILPFFGISSPDHLPAPDKPAELLRLQP